MNDLISRQDVLKELSVIQDRPVSTAMKIIKAIPSAEKVGRNLKEDTPTLFECSICGWTDWDTITGDTDTYNYCPNCGARMEERKWLK